MRLSKKSRFSRTFFSKQGYSKRACKPSLEKQATRTFRGFLQGFEPVCPQAVIGLCEAL
jgi:hypothetical protein